uniref:ATP synthase F0 subunit 8 n=1 Tax=Quadrella coronata TaxID=652071 RepID=UPI0028D623F0|nr:ATP synthase F0 subunit 8 [Quadrella coronata]WMQ53288.1 ATP synthase F0 subunit 8 [Quadrella coronata]
MPQMAPLLWTYLYIFFIVGLMLFFMLTYFIKPYKTINSFTLSSTLNTQKPWKL